jgi:hypothetical protein
MQRRRQKSKQQKTRAKPLPPDMSIEDSEFTKLRELAHMLEVDVAVLKSQRDAAEKALTLAKEALDAYKAANNEWGRTFSEWRGQMSQYMLTQTADARFDKESGQRGALADRVVSLEGTKKEQSGRTAGIDKTWALVITLVLVGLGVVGLWLKMTIVSK